MPLSLILLGQHCVGLAAFCQLGSLQGRCLALQTFTLTAPMWFVQLDQGSTTVLLKLWYHADTLVLNLQFLHDGHLPDGPCSHDPVAHPAQ